jgi:hypothetical protein
MRSKVWWEEEWYSGDWKKLIRLVWWSWYRQQDWEEGEESVEGFAVERGFWEQLWQITEEQFKAARSMASAAISIAMAVADGISANKVNPITPVPQPISKIFGSLIFVKIFSFRIRSMRFSVSDLGIKIGWRHW